jgi:pimeloyl-ACP methyl ester carboxylesterase
VRTKRIATPVASLHVYDAEGRGDLPPVVLLHGLGSAGTAFGPLLERLRPHVQRVVVPDYPGHGYSERTARLTPEALFESVAHALNSLALEPAILVGNSLGGAVALTYTLANPQKVRALVLVSPAGAHATEEEWTGLRATFSLESTAAARAFIERLYHRPPWIVRLLAHEFPLVMGTPAVRDLLASASNEHLPAPDALRGLSMPILFLWGASERLLPDSHLAWFERCLPEHAIVERPIGFGHCPHFDDPDALAARITAFARAHVR